MRIIVILISSDYYTVLCEYEILLATVAFTLCLSMMGISILYNASHNLFIKLRGSDLLLYLIFSYSLNA